MPDQRDLQSLSFGGLCNGAELVWLGVAVSGNVVGRSLASSSVSTVDQSSTMTFPTSLTSSAHLSGSMSLVATYVNAATRVSLVTLLTFFTSPVLAECLSSSIIFSEVVMLTLG